MAEKQAERECKRIEEENSKKAIQPSEKRKGKASKPPATRQKKEAWVQVIAEVEDAEAQNPPHVITTRRDRNINSPLNSNSTSFSQ